MHGATALNLASGTACRDRHKPNEEQQHTSVNPHPTSSLRIRLVIALIAGVVTPLAFAPVGLWPLQLATLALVLHMVAREDKPMAAALTGWAYSFGWLVTGVHWLYISMHDFGGMPGWMSALAVCLLALYLAAYTALLFGAAVWLRSRWQLSPVPTLLLVLPACWMLAEWLRGWMFTGFPWTSTGYAHTDSPLSGFAPLLGVYGIALLAALVAGCIAAVRIKRWPLALAVALLGAGVGMSRVAWTTPNGEPLTVRLIQGNVPQNLKFEPEQLQFTLARYHEMITAQPADLIATPETAIPILSTQLPPDYIDHYSAFSRKTGSSVLLGLPFSEGRGHYANSALGVTTDGAVRYRYDKHHLVPFGEFIPFGFRWFVDMMRIPLGDFTPGNLAQPAFAVRGQQVLPNICYEDLFGEEIARQIRIGTPQPTVLLNISNIAWFGDSIALPQHLQISRMRSLETGRPMLRATNTGATAVIDAKGSVQALLPFFTRDTLAASVAGYQGMTPYIRYGNLPVLALVAALLAAAWVVARKLDARQGRKPHAQSENR